MHSTMADAADLLARLESEVLPLEDRAVAGRKLARLGDARATAIDRVKIPAGVYRRRATKGDARSVHVSEYWIDRYPVTVAAFAEFIEAGGYRSKRYWSAAGWAWRAGEQVTLPRFWGEDEWSAYLVPNHPVVGVSAFEAEAYASFRDARLPTEAEWEKACCGEAGRCYPWGDVWEEGACAKRGLTRGTLPIGIFPRGSSPYGVRDMVGCVWQWCRDVADAEAPEGDSDPFVDPEDYAEDAPRVTRGGGWNNLPWNLHCNSRNGYPPASRFSNLGFRIVALEG
jgi:gamma-glutamyl hercynylcysteine S-oxide synthase